MAVETLFTDGGCIVFDTQAILLDNAGVSVIILHRAVYRQCLMETGYGLLWSPGKGGGADNHDAL